QLRAGVRYCGATPGRRVRPPLRARADRRERGDLADDRRPEPDRPTSDPTRERIERRSVLCGLITKTSSAYGRRRPCVASDASMPGICPAAFDVGSEWFVQRNSYGGLVLNLSRLDLEEIATALADQTDYEHRYLINPQTGEIVFWTSDTGIDGQTPVDLD